jgi:hypothetical protein
MARLRNLRDFAEHVDEKVAGGVVKQESPLMQVPLADGLEYAGEWLPYRELADWIVRLELLAERLVSYEPGPDVASN